MASTDLRFDVQALDRASQVFTRMGKAVESFEKRLQRLDKQSATVEVEAKTEKAERAVGAFAVDMRKRLEAAVKALPEIEIDADSTQAQRDIARVRAALAELADQRIGVDIDAGDAEARMRLLQAELAELSDNADIQVRADARQAVAALGEVRHQIGEADREVGAFARQLQTRLAAAIRALPDIEIDAEASDAEREVARIRAQLVSLGDQRIGIDIDASTAQAEVARLEAELRALGDVEDVAVHADVTAALAQLAAVNGEVDKLDGRTARVKVDVDRSWSDAVVRVAALGRALGTLTLPAAALASAPAIASIGAAAVTASGSLGLIPAAAGAAAVGIGTVTLATQNLFGAFDDNEDKAAEALAKLGPAGRQAYEAIRGLSGAWDEFQGGIEERLLVGVGEQISKLGRTYLPEATTELGRVADGFNRAGIGVANMLTRTERVGDIRVMLGSLATSWENILAAVEPTTEAIVDIGVVGSGVLRDLTSGAGDAARGFRDFIADARKSGDLARWMQAGVEQVKQFGRISRDAGVTVYNVFRSAEEAGAGFFDTVERVTSATRAWTSSAEGSDRITQIFRTLRETTDAVVPGVQALGRVVGDVLDGLVEGRALQRAAATFSAVAEAAEPVLSVLGAIATTVLPPLLDAATALAPVLVPVAAGLLAIKLATAGWAAAQRFPAWLVSARDGALGAEQRLTALGRVVDGVRAPFGAAATGVRRFSDEMRLQQALAASSGQQIGRLGSAMAVLEQRLDGPISAAKQLGADMSASYRQTSTAVQSFAGVAGSAGREASEALGNRLASAVQRGVDGILGLPAAARAAGTAVRTGLISSLDATERTLRALPGTVSAAAASVRTGLVTGATAAGTALRSLGTQAADAGRAVGSGLATSVRAGADGLRAIGPAAVSAGTALASGLRSGTTSAVEALRALPSAAADAGRSLGNSLQSGAQTAGRAVADGLRAGVTAGVDAVRALPGQVASAASATATAAANGLRAIPDHIRNAFSTVGSAVDTAVGHLGRLGGAVAGAATSMGTGLVRAGSSLVGFLGGPWGVALAAAGVALSLLAANHAEAEQAAQEHKGALEALRGTLDQYSGAVTQATVNERAKELSTKTLADGTTTYLQAVRSLGIDLNDYTQASLGNASALDRVRAQLDANTSSTIAASREYQVLQGPLAAAGITMSDFTAAASGSQEATDRIREAIGQLPDATGRANGVLTGMFNRLLENSGASAQLAEQLGITTGELAAIQDQVRLAAEASGQLTTQLTSVKSAFDAVPGQKSVTVDALTQPAQDQLSSLGLRVETLPNGRVQVTADTEQARANLDAFIAGAANTSATIRIGADNLPAQAALGAILGQIQAGAATVTINGQSMPAQAALSYALGLINQSNGTVTINGQDVPARAALSAYIAAVNSGSGTATINGNRVPADQVLRALIGTVNSSSGTITANANVGAAERAINNAARPRTVTITGQFKNAPGLTGLATGGPVFGPGSETSDSIDAKLSNNEHVWTAREVRNAGGHGQVMRLRSLAAQGRLPRFATGGPVRVELTTSRRLVPSRSAAVSVPRRYATGGPIRADEAVARFRDAFGGGGALSPVPVRPGGAPVDLAPLAGAVTAVAGQVRALRGDVDQGGYFGELIGEIRGLRRDLARAGSGGGSYAETARDASLFGGWP